MRILVFSIFTCLTLASCETFFNQTVKVDPPEYTPQLVFHVRLTNHDSAVKVLLTRSFGLLEEVQNGEQYFVSDAVVEWWQAGQKIMTLTPLSPDSDFVYVGVLPQPLQRGLQYEIRASHAGFPSVQASQIMPDDNFLVDTGYVRETLDQFGERQTEISAVISDPANERNYYELKGYYASYDIQTFYDPVTMQYTYDTVGLVYAPVNFDEFPDPNVQAGVGGTAMVSDQFFNGQTYRLQGSYYGPLYSSDFRVVVRNVSEEYYKWSRGYFQQVNSDFVLFAEPFTVYSNVENGLGIFGLMSEKQKDIH